MKRQFFSMGEVLMYLKKSNITDLEQRAEYIQGFIDRENQETGYDYNRYVEYGAANLANVVTEHSKAKKRFIPRRFVFRRSRLTKAGSV
jgi:hypothetical protein